MQEKYIRVCVCVSVCVCVCWEKKKEQGVVLLAAHTTIVISLLVHVYIYITLVIINESKRCVGFKRLQSFKGISGNLETPTPLSITKSHWSVFIVSYSCLLLSIPTATAICVISYLNYCFCLPNVFISLSSHLLPLIPTASRVSIPDDECDHATPLLKILLWHYIALSVKSKPLV